MNLTLLTSGPADAEMSTLQANLKLYRPELELLWVLLTYGPYLPAIMRYSSGKFTRARQYPYLVLVTHIITGQMLVLRYHARFAAMRVLPRPELWDLALFAVFTSTSFILQTVRSSRQYNAPAGRSGFQVAILIQTVVFAASWLRGGDPALFRASIKLFNWFASFRFFRRWADWISPGIQKDFALHWSTSVVLSGTFAMWEADVPAGVPVFLGLVATFMVMERAVAETIYGCADGNPIKRLVLASGYVDYNHLKLKATPGDGGECGRRKRRQG